MAVTNLVINSGGKKRIEFTANFAVASTATLAEATAVSITGADGVVPGDRVVAVNKIDQSSAIPFYLSRWVITAAGAISLYFVNGSAGTTSISAADWRIVVEKAPAQH